jgi:membrane protein DedA with SNARE-associated domain
MDTADKWFGTYGEATAFFSRLLPVIRTFISLPAGISRMNFGKFCVYTFIGALPYCFALTYAGMKLGEHWIEVSKVLHKADAVILGILAVFFALWVYRHIRGSQASASRKS